MMMKMTMKITIIQALQAPQWLARALQPMTQFHVFLTTTNKYTSFPDNTESNFTSPTPLSTLKNKNI